MVGKAARQTGRAMLAVIGLIDGILSGLLGIGGAVFLVPVLTAVVKVTQHQAHGTALAAVPFTAVTSGAIYVLSGNLDLTLAVSIVATSILGAIVGARLMHRLPATVLRRIFALFLFVVGVRMLTGDLFHG